MLLITILATPPSGRSKHIKSRDTVSAVSLLFCKRWSPLWSAVFFYIRRSVTVEYNIQFFQILRGETDMKMSIFSTIQENTTMFALLKGGCGCLSVG